MEPIVDESAHRLAFGRLSELASDHDLTIHDASYVELALRERIPLATKDAALRVAARAAGARVRSASS